MENKNLEDILINRIKPLIELSDIMLDLSSDHHEDDWQGKRIFALNTAMDEHLKATKREIEEIEYGEEKTGCPSAVTPGQP